MDDTKTTNDVRRASSLDYPVADIVTVTVDYNTSFAAPGVDKSLVNSAPQHGEGVKQKQVELIPLRRIPDNYADHQNGMSQISDKDLEQFLEDHGLVFEDLQTANVVSQVHSGYIGVQWKFEGDFVKAVFRPTSRNQNNFQIEKELNKFFGALAAPVRVIGGFLFLKNRKHHDFFTFSLCIDQNFQVGRRHADLGFFY